MTPHNSFSTADERRRVMLRPMAFFSAYRYTFFSGIVRLIPVEKRSLQVLVTSPFCTLPPETASVFITTVKMQSEKRWLTVGFVFC